MPSTRGSAIDNTTIQPFTIAIDDARLDAIRSHVAAFDWDALPDAGGGRPFRGA